MSTQLLFYTQAKPVNAAEHRDLCVKSGADFGFAQGRDATTLTLCIDEQFSGCNREGRGEHLFDADGERTAYLEQVLNFVRTYQVQHQRTLAFCKKLVELDLLQPVQANLTPASGERRVLSGLRVIDRNKLKALNAETVHGLMTSGELELIYLQLHSLPNLRVIGERMPRGTTEETAPPADTGAMEESSEKATKH
jgi:hypothetical protein